MREREENGRRGASAAGQEMAEIWPGMRRSALNRLGRRCGRRDGTVGQVCLADLRVHHRSNHLVESALQVLLIKRRAVLTVVSRATGFHDNGRLPSERQVQPDRQVEPWRSSQGETVQIDRTRTSSDLWISGLSLSLSIKDNRQIIRLRSLTKRSVAFQLNNKQSNPIDESNSECPIKP
jgi:hypothetical protein